jgi:V8-like Glu-specific endopeptidase
VAGYPADRGAGVEQYHGRNRILRVSDRRLFYEVDTYGGQSGAPVWIHENDDATPLAVGVHAYGIGGTPTNFGITANSAPRIIPEVLDKLTEWVERDGGWP